MESVMSGRRWFRPKQAVTRRRMRPALAALLLLLAALAVVAGAGGCGGASTANSEPVYDFPIALYQGADAVGGSEALRLSDLRGQPVILNFWAGLCPPCRAEMPEFQAFADAYAGRALVVGVDLGQFFSLGGPDDARRLLNDLAVTYPAGYTEDGNVTRELAVTGLPATLFITPDGGLHRRWVGVLDGDKLAEITDAMLAE